MGNLFLLEVLPAFFLFKKPSLEPTILDNFCPICHLSFWGKVAEKMVALQLQRILKEMNSLDPFSVRFQARI